MKVVSSQVAFVDGKRVRPGTVFEIPDGQKLGVGMVRAEDVKPKVDRKMGDIKPTEAQEAVKRKTGHVSDMV